MLEYRSFLNWQYQDKNKVEYLSKSSFEEAKEMVVKTNDVKEVNKENYSDFCQAVWNCAKKVPFDWKLTLKYYKSKYPTIKGDKLSNMVKEELVKLRKENL